MNQNQNVKTTFGWGVQQQILSKSGWQESWSMWVGWQESDNRQTEINKTVHLVWRIHGLVVERLTLVLVQAHCTLSLVARLALYSASELFPPIPFLFTEHKECWDSIWYQLISVVDTNKYKKGLVLIFYQCASSSN
jgi:hypothetical protein